VGRKRWAQPNNRLSLDSTISRVLVFTTAVFSEWAKSNRGAAPIFFGPCTLGRTWGTRPISSGLCYDAQKELTASPPINPYPKAHHAEWQ
jgi:hypothetical protein